MKKNLSLIRVGDNNDTIDNYIYVDSFRNDMQLDTLLDYAQSEDNYYPFEIYEDDNDTKMYLEALLKKLRKKKHKTKLLAFSLCDIPYSESLANKIQNGMLEIEFYNEDIVLNQKSLNFTMKKWKFESEIHCLSSDLNKL